MTLAGVAATAACHSPPQDLMWTKTTYPSCTRLASGLGIGDAARPALRCEPRCVSSWRSLQDRQQHCACAHGAHSLGTPRTSKMVQTLAAPAYCTQPTSTRLVACALNLTPLVSCVRGNVETDCWCAMRARQKNGHMSAQRATSGRALRNSEHRDAPWRPNTIVVARCVRSALGVSDILMTIAVGRWTRCSARDVMRSDIRWSAPCACKRCTARSFQTARSITLRINHGMSSLAAPTATSARSVVIARMRGLSTRTQRVA